MGVAGFKTTPGFTPRDRISWIVRWRCLHASTWTEIVSAPAFAKASKYWSGFSIIKWTSSGSFVTGRTAPTTSGPIVMFGTKWPSITSIWIQSAPPSSTSLISSPNFAKFADKIEGAIFTIVNTSAFCF
ncbi:hypothetical protein BCO26_1087 [Heyndrickxia coagulans 2-6]|nr:hypothetical protein BCO26_1087 [Heyndrickxia coagulans 2-6]